MAKALKYEERVEYMKYLGYALYMVLVLLLLGPIFVAPFIAQGMPGLFNSLQDVYAPACHQLANRSLCYFADGSIGDCVQDSIDGIGRQRIVHTDGDVLGYKFPVCARDVAIYGAMILGGLVFPFVRKVDDKIAPPLIYFIIALVPIALDGGTQLIGIRESTNDLRLITGFIAGIVVPFYLIPILNMFVLGPDKKAFRK